MAVDEAARHQLYTSLESALGPEPTSTLMSLLPPVGWAEVATRQDLVAFRDGLRAEIADLRTDLRTGLAEASVERATLRSELKGDIAQLRGEMHTSIRNAVFAMIGAMCTLAGLTWAATSLT